MDELDRMYRRLVQNLRTGNPDYLSRPFEVAELYQTIIPYRHNRRELELETNQDYEMTLLRLLSGERGYLTGDPAMQDALRRELSSPNPDLSAFRAWATNEVRLSDGAEVPATTPVPEMRTGVSADARPTAPLDVTPDASRAAAPSMAPPIIAPPSAAPPSAFPPSAAPPDMGSGSAAPTLPPMPAARAQTPLPAPPIAASVAPAPPLTLGSTPPAGADIGPRTTTAIYSNGGSCRYCGGQLPEGRHITFCPHCGQNLTVRHCPACGTELEVGWRFCTTCGRDVGPTSL